MPESKVCTTGWVKACTRAVQIASGGFVLARSFALLRGYQRVAWTQQRHAAAAPCCARLSHSEYFGGDFCTSEMRITLDSSGMGTKVRCGACAPSSMPPPMNSVSLMSQGMRSCSTLHQKQTRLTMCAGNPESSFGSALSELIMWASQLRTCFISNKLWQGYVIMQLLLTMTAIHNHEERFDGCRT